MSLGFELRVSVTCASGLQSFLCENFIYLLCFRFPLDNRLDVYIYDYLMKRKLHASAKAFQAEGKVSTDPVGRHS